MAATVDLPRESRTPAGSHAALPILLSGTIAQPPEPRRKNSGTGSALHPGQTPTTPAPGQNFPSSSPKKPGKKPRLAPG